MVYSNFVPYEDFLSGDRVVEFNWKARKLILTNQSATKKLLFKFQDNTEYGTLNPTEEATISDLYRKKIYLRALNGEVPYRLWVFG